MTVAVVGCGYVGLVTAVALAAAGWPVVAIDADPRRCEGLREGRAPFDEPGVEALLRGGLASGRLRIEGELEAAGGCAVVMVAVPTAPDGDDPTEDVVRAVARLTEGIVVLRGTLTPERADRLAKAAAPRAVVANPEFLREGHALADLRAPARLVLGGDPAAIAQVEALYARVHGPEVPVIRTDLASACLAKLASNAMLAVRVAFANEVARICGDRGASAEDVLRIVGLDPRIGPAHLGRSLGFGGPCLPKDARMLAPDSVLVEAALRANEDRLERVCAALVAGLGELGGARVAVWGQTFKPGTDDVRVSPAVELARRLAAAGAEVAVHDPRVSPGDPAAVVDGADALVVGTAWPEYAAIDPSALRPRRRLLFDPPGLLGARWREAGWEVWT